MNKYGNIEKVIDGIIFQSIKEANRYQELKLLLKAKKKKKGKLIQEAMVCFACYDEGHNKIPLDEFNGRVKFVPQAQLPKQIMEKMLKQKEEAQKKVEKAKSLNII